jgi:hypothetical protein
LRAAFSVERLDDELLRVVADLQGLERCDSHLSYRANIVMRLVPDDDLWIHGLIFLFLAGQRKAEREPALLAIRFSVWLCLTVRSNLTYLSVGANK